jgi:hypothetical protein
MKDTGERGADGLQIQEMTLHILPAIKFDPNQTAKENAERMKTENERAWADVYKNVYGAGR